MTTKLIKTQTAYPVMEAFYTLQGEGAHTGKAAYFIRLAGCDVGCVWCDVKESWDTQKHPMLTVENIVTQAAANPARIAVITGGEPLMHDLGPLTRALKQSGFAIHIETSGAHPLSGGLDWICLSPKKFKAPLPEVAPMANELKSGNLPQKRLWMGRTVCSNGRLCLSPVFATRVGQKRSYDPINYQLH